MAKGDTDKMAFFDASAQTDITLATESSISHLAQRIYLLVTLHEVKAQTIFLHRCRNAHLRSSLLCKLSSIKIKSRSANQWRADGGPRRGEYPGNPKGIHCRGNDQHKPGTHYRSIQSKGVQSLVTTMKKMAPGITKRLHATLLQLLCFATDLTFFPFNLSAINVNEEPFYRK